MPKDREARAAALWDAMWEGERKEWQDRRQNDGSLNEMSAGNNLYQAAPTIPDYPEALPLPGAGPQSIGRCLTPSAETNVDYFVLLLW